MLKRTVHRSNTDDLTERDLARASGGLWAREHVIADEANPDVLRAKIYGEARGWPPPSEPDDYPVPG